jgi:hypothetical protein
MLRGPVTCREEACARSMPCMFAVGRRVLFGISQRYASPHATRPDASASDTCSSTLHFAPRYHRRAEPAHASCGRSSIDLRGWPAISPPPIRSTTLRSGGLVVMDADDVDLICPLGVVQDLDRGAALQVVPEPVAMVLSHSMMMSQPFWNRPSGSGDTHLVRFTVEKKGPPPEGSGPATVGLMFRRDTSHATKCRRQRPTERDRTTDRYRA